MAGGIRLTKLHRRSLIALFLFSWLSGIAFFSLDRWGAVEGEFGPEKHPWQFTVLKSHGAAAFLMMINFGFLLAAHVPKGWRVRDMRPLGLVLVLAVSISISTAYLLYYLGDEGLRQVTRTIHISVGFCLPFLLLAHLRQGLRRRNMRRRSRRRPVGQEIYT